MKYLISSLLCIIFIFSACNHSVKPSQDPVSGLKHFENDYLSFDYPAGWEIEKTINHEPDATSGLKESFSLLISTPTGMSYGAPAVFIVKSGMGDFFDNPETWRDLSIELKNAGNDYYEVEAIEDSIVFAGEPAAFVMFKTVPEGFRDTIIQGQLVVLRENKDLFYINNQFFLNDTTDFDSCLDIISSIAFK